MLTGTEQANRSRTRHRPDLCRANAIARPLMTASLQRHAPSSRGVLLLRQDAIAALVGVLAIVLERDLRGPREAPWR